MSRFSKKTEPPRRPPAAGGERARRKPVAFGAFFSRQILLFAGVLFALLMLDFVMFIGFEVSQTGVASDTLKPHGATINACTGLSQNGEGIWEMSQEGYRALEDGGAAWACFVLPDGSIAWEYGYPARMPRVLSATDLAMAGHFNMMEGYPVFFYTRDEGMIIAAWPQGSFWSQSLTFSDDQAFAVILLAISLFVADALVLFLLYAIAKRRTQRTVKPLTDALDELSCGRSAELHLSGDLAEVGDRVTEVSRLIERKDESRSMWIRGVSHDIRTPLSMVVGLADTIASEEGNPQRVREQAETIRMQGLKISDLVTDLNTAAQLDYGAKPAGEACAHLARLLREVCAEHVNAGFGERFPLTCDIAPDAANAQVMGDYRMLKRAVENLMSNVRSHNPQGCAVHVSLDAPGDIPNAGQPSLVCVRVADEGAGTAPEQLRALRERIERARKTGTVAAAYGDEHGLGLVLVDRICQTLGGTFEFSSGEGGFTAEMRLPL